MQILEVVPIFYLEQDSSCDQPCELISRERAREMKKLGLGWFIDHGKAFRLAGRTPVIEDPASERPGALETAVTISYSEMRANVGLVDDRVKNPREAIRMAQAKVRLYPFIFDRQAQLAAIPIALSRGESLIVTAQA